MAKRPAKRRSHKRPSFIIAKAEDIETVERILNASDVQEDANYVQNGPLDNMPDGDEDDEDEGDVMGDGD